MANKFSKAPAAGESGAGSGARPGARPAAGRAEQRRYEAVVERVAALVRAGTYRPGDRIPSVRQAAARHGLAVGTILHAYRLLEDRGYIEARPQSGYFARAPRPAMAQPARSAPEGTAVRPTVAQLVMKMGSLLSAADVVPLGHAVPSPDCLPTRQLNRISASLARRSRRGLQSYDPPPGCRELRAQLARLSAEAGCTLAPDDFVTTCGCQEALSLCLRAVAGEGDVIAVGTPGFYGHLQAIQLLGMKALEVPTDPARGVDLDALDRLLRRRRVAACLFTTNCQNPLGFVTPEPDKRALVRLLADLGVPLIEDDIYGDLAYEHPRPTVCKAFDRSGGVLLCSSFSKTLAPGARVGWCAPGRYFEEVACLKFSSTVATPTLPQLAIAEFLSVGGYAHHLRRMRRRYALHGATYARAIDRHFPAGTKATRPAGGHVLWVELDPRVDSIELFQQAIRQNISIAPGPLFSPADAYRNCLRLNYSPAWTPAVERAISTLGTLAKRQLSS